MLKINDKLTEEDYLNELETSLRKAFVDDGADFIILDGQTARSEFIRDGINHGLKKGWLCQGEDIDEDKVLGQGRGQYCAYTYRLTDKGKRYFGIKKP